MIGIRKLPIKGSGEILISLWSFFIMGGRKIPEWAKE
jgi:hypothetical protein